jgi:hypothetical protein
VDSDFQLSDDDEDLDAENPDEGEHKVDRKIRERVRQVMEAKREENLDADITDDPYSEEEDMWAPDSDDEKGSERFHTFREEDLKCVKFHVGQVFESVHMVRKAIKEYSCQNKWDIKLPVNDLKRIKGKCYGGLEKDGVKQDCISYLWASYDSRTKCWRIKRYQGEHTCSRKWKIKGFTTNFLADKYLESFRADQDMNMKNFSRIF